MRKLIPVEGHTGMYRDPNSNAIVCVDDDKRQQAKKKNSALRANLNKIKTQEDEINSLRKDVSELKDLVAALINKLESKNG